MSQHLSEKLMLLAGEPTHWCPGCGMLHRISVSTPNEVTGAKWTWNQDPIKPTFSPSVNIVGRCHYFLREGVLEFCQDSTHDLAGKSIPLPDIPFDERD